MAALSELVAAAHAGNLHAELDDRGHHHHHPPR